MALRAKPRDPFDEAVARQLAAAADGSGASQRAIAAEAGLTQSRLNYILRGNGAPATVGEVHVIAQALGLKVSDLFERAETMVAFERAAEAVNDSDEAMVDDSDEGRWLDDHDTQPEGVAPVLGAARFARLGVTADVPEHAAAQVTKRSITDEQEHWD